jgi:hypothetical protein
VASGHLAATSAVWSLIYVFHGPIPAWLTHGPVIGLGILCHFLSFTALNWCVLIAWGRRFSSAEEKGVVTMDKLTKIFFLLIALGLWVNVLRRPTPVHASMDYSSLVYSELTDINGHVSSIDSNTADLKTIHCKGKFTVNAWGSVEPNIGGYEVELRCEPGK